MSTQITEITLPQFTNWEQAVRWLRKQPSQRHLVMAAYYDDPLHVAAERYRQSAEWSAIRPLLPCAQDATALDVGAGQGIESYALAYLKKLVIYMNYSNLFLEF